MSLVELNAVSAGRRSLATLPWIVAALVALTITGASAYLLGTAPTGGPQRASVILSDPHVAGTMATVDVLTAAPAYGLGEYASRILVDNATAGDLNPLMDGAFDRILSFSDRDGDGILSAGDRFGVERGAVGDFVLFVLWRSEQVGLEGWRDSVAVALAPESPIPSGYAVEVATASLPRPLGEYAALLNVDLGTYGRLRTLSDGARDGNLSFTDIDASGTLTAGDRFAIDRAEPGTYTLVVTWRTTEVARRSWTQPVPPGAPVIALCCLGGGYMTPFGATVGSADPSLPSDQYRAVLLRNGTAFRELNPLNGPADGTFSFTDNDRDGNLSAGDRFTFDCSPEQVLMGQCPAPLPSRSHYEFRLYWGTLLAAALTFDR